MTHLTPAAPPMPLLAHVLKVLRMATLERLILRGGRAPAMEDGILLESHLVRTPPELFAAPKAPLI